MDVSDGSTTHRKNNKHRQSRKSGKQIYMYDCISKMNQRNKELKALPQQSKER